MKLARIKKANADMRNVVMMQQYMTHIFELQQCLMASQEPDGGTADGKKVNIHAIRSRD
jgi:hypothetical protein